MEYKIDYETHLGEEDCDLLRATEFSVSTTFGSRGPYQKKKEEAQLYSEEYCGRFLASHASFSF